MAVYKIATWTDLGIIICETYRNNGAEYLQVNWNWLKTGWSYPNHWYSCIKALWCLHYGAVTNWHNQPK